MIESSSSPIKSYQLVDNLRRDASGITSSFPHVSTFDQSGKKNFTESERKNKDMMRELILNRNQSFDKMKRYGSNKRGSELKITGGQTSGISARMKQS